MVSRSKLRVVVAGASGETGRSIMEALLAESAQFDVVALARPESADKAVYQELAQAGASIETADFCDIEVLAKKLTGTDIVISCIMPLQRVESETLIDASHRAGVGRFVPSFFAMVMPPRGIMEARDMKEDLLDRCKRAYLPYTVIDVGAWYQLNLPPPYAAPPPIGDIFIGTGETPNALIDKYDIGPYVARIITDPRTVNRSVFAYGEVTTQKAIWAECEAATGKEILRDCLSAANLEDRITELRSSAAKDPTNIGLVLELAMSQYRYSRHVRGDNAPDRAQYLGYLDAKTLYPDLKCNSMRHFIHEVVDGTRDHSVYRGRDPVADATQRRN